MHLRGVHVMRLRNGELEQVDTLHARLAEDVAFLFNMLQERLFDKYGWSVIISGSRSMWRSPEDQAYLLKALPQYAARQGASPHQAGRAFDADLNGMAEYYLDFDKDKFIQVCRECGFLQTVNSEPWHFDTADFRLGWADIVPQKFKNIQEAIKEVS